MQQMEDFLPVNTTPKLIHVEPIGEIHPQGSTFQWFSFTNNET